MMKEATFYEQIDNNTVKCNLCPHYCDIHINNSGLCNIRKNIDGKLYTMTYAEISSIAIDPIEKKPLYHFYPGHNILSLGSSGCNLKCPFCQNWSISNQLTKNNSIDFEYLERTIKEQHSIGIAYTYNEPLISYELLKDCSTFMKEKGIKNIIVSNGMINTTPLNGIKKNIDAANIDIKGFTDDFYKYVCGDLQTVKKTITTLFENGTHLELTNLIIPTKNDDKASFIDMCKWIASISKDIPLHISRYFPNYKVNIPPTPLETLKLFYKLASQELNYVYIGNANIPETNNTKCPRCHTTVIDRTNTPILLNHRKKTCPKCDTSLYLYC